MPQIFTLLGSLAAGVAQVVVGQPFDTIKSYTQSKGWRRAWHKVTRASASSLPRFLYRGTKFSGYNALVNNVSVFNAYAFAKHGGGFTTAESGCLAGLAATPSAFFFDGCKIIKQVNGPGAAVSPSAMLLRHGLAATAAREMVGLTAHFTAYEYARERLGMDPLLAGGLRRSQQLDGLLPHRCGADPPDRLERVGVARAL